jgi:hypothetical protein
MEYDPIMNRIKSLILTSLIAGLVIIVPSCGVGDAADYANKLGTGYTSLGCVGSDSDDDGYVSCTIREPDGQRSGIQCATGHGSCNASGCKEDAARLR